MLFFGTVEQLEAREQLLGGPVDSVVDTGGYVILRDALLASNDNLTGISSVAVSDASADLSQYQVAGQLPDLGSFFSIPATGWNWGYLHNHNAVDIANACGTPIYAAAEGMVTEAQEGSWNDGYGSYIVVNHSNNTATKYAHNKKNLVAVGQYVVRGDLIAYVGNTGNTHGPTGCHLHFEVRGAKNPFAKK